MTPPRRDASSTDLVILVHGLWMHGVVCTALAYRLRRGGHRVALFSYRSLRWAMNDIAVRLHAYTVARQPARVHFAGHSLGGLVILSMLSRFHDLPAGRVVLLGSPCTECEAARQLGRRRGGGVLLGRALHGWSSSEGEAVARVVPVGIVAGTRRIGMGSLLATLHGPNDGVVRVEETRLPGIADHLVMPVSHSGLLLSRAVADQVLCFLREGRFAHGASA
ncbi:MAG: hypothetical protein IT532_02720 [Burkholderiales bacterium]|nr:hypothetical protein [Burkholderiales bacterium]